MSGANTAAITTMARSTRPTTIEGRRSIEAKALVSRRTVAGAGLAIGQYLTRGSTSR
jgi:hypothetical protein